MMKPDPKLLCLNSLLGVSPKNRSKKSSPPKYRSKGVRPPKGDLALPLRTVFVVLMLTTVGFSRSARSAKDDGVLPISAVETAAAV